MPRQREPDQTVRHLWTRLRHRLVHLSHASLWKTLVSSQRSLFGLHLWRSYLIWYEFDANIHKQFQTFGWKLKICCLNENQRTSTKWFCFKRHHRPLWFRLLRLSNFRTKSIEGQKRWLLMTRVWAKSIPSIKNLH